MALTPTEETALGSLITAVQRLCAKLQQDFSGAPARSIGASTHFQLGEAESFAALVTAAQEGIRQTVSPVRADAVLLSDLPTISIV